MGRQSAESAAKKPLIAAVVGLAVLLATATVWAGDCGGPEPCSSGAEAAATQQPPQMAAPPPPSQPQQPQGGGGRQAVGRRRSEQGQPQPQGSIPYSVYNEAMKAEKRQQTKESGGPAVAVEPEVLYPEKTVYATLSSSDTNRFVCTTGEIGDIIAPEEKGVIKEHSGNEGWVKFQIERDPSSGQLVFASFDTDIFIKCGGETYSIIGRPKQGLPAKTFYLVSPSKGQAKEAERMSALDLDKAVAYIVQRVFLDDVPPHWEEIKIDGAKRYRVAGVLVEPVISWKIPGVDVVVRLFTLRMDAGPVRVEESDLLHPSLVVNPVGISIKTHSLDNEHPTTPAVIIERLERRRDA